MPKKKYVPRLPYVLALFTVDVSAFCEVFLSTLATIMSARSVAQLAQRTMRAQAKAPTRAGLDYLAPGEVCMFLVLARLVDDLVVSPLPQWT